MAARRPPRVLRFYGTLDPRLGGTVAAISESTRALHSHVDARVFVQRAGRERPQGIALIVGPDRFFRRVALASRWIRHSDVVLIEGAWSPRAALYSALARRFDVPYVYVPHGSLTSDVRARHPARHVKKLLWWLLVERRVASGAAGIWYATEQEAKRSRATFPGMPSTGLVLPHTATDFESVASVTAPANPVGPRHAIAEQSREIRCVTACRIAPVKSLDLALLAVAEAASKGRQIHLTIAGDGDPALAASLRRLVTELGITDRVEWIGFVQPAELAQLYARSDVYLCPGIESFGMAVVEALSAGLPVVATPANALARQIDAAGAGACVDPHEAGAMVEAIIRLGGSMDASAAARQLYEREYAAAQFGPRFITMLETFGVLDAGATTNEVRVSRPHASVPE